MIAEVSPTDAAKLDKIDAAFWSFWTRRRIAEISVGYEGEVYYSFDGETLDFQYDDPNSPPTSTPDHRVTRSRDALKAIRPAGWIFDILSRNDFSYGCVAECPTARFQAFDFRTEELAELHATIQAIQHQRAPKESHA